MNCVVLTAVYRDLKGRFQATRDGPRHRDARIAEAEILVLRDVAAAIVAARSTDRSALLPASDEVVMFTLSVDPAWLTDAVLGNRALLAAFFTCDVGQRKSIYEACIRTNARDDKRPTAYFFVAQTLLGCLGANGAIDNEVIATVVKDLYVNHDTRIVLGWATELDKLESPRLLTVAHNLIVGAGRQRIERATDVCAVVAEVARSRQALRVGGLAARCVSTLLRCATEPPVSLRISTWVDALALSNLVLILNDLEMFEEPIVTAADEVLNDVKSSLIDCKITLGEFETFVERVRGRPEAIALLSTSDEVGVPIDEVFVEDCVAVIKSVHADTAFVDTFLLEFCPSVVDAGFAIAELDAWQREWAEFKEVQVGMQVGLFVKSRKDRKDRFKPSWPSEEGTHGVILSSPAAMVVRQHPELGRSRIFSNAARAVAATLAPAAVNADADADADVDAAADDDANAAAADADGAEALISFDDDAYSEFLTNGLRKIQTQFSTFARATTPEQTLADAAVAWEGVRPEDIDIECELLARFGASRIACRPGGDVNLALQSRGIAERLQAQAEQLGAVAEIFGYADCDSPVRSAIAVLTAIDDDCTLKQLHKATLEVQTSTRRFSAQSWELVEALSGSKELVDFVTELPTDEIHALIDAVEEKYAMRIPPCLQTERKGWTCEVCVCADDVVG